MILPLHHLRAGEKEPGEWCAGRDSNPQDPVPETGMILPLHHLRVGEKEGGAQGGIRTRKPLFLKQVCLPLHHLRVKRSEGGSNAQAHCRAASITGCRSASKYGPGGNRTRIAALKGRCPGRLDEGILFCPDAPRVSGRRRVFNLPRRKGEMVRRAGFEPAGPCL